MKKPFQGLRGIMLWKSFIQEIGFPVMGSCPNSISRRSSIVHPTILPFFTDTREGGVQQHRVLLKLATHRIPLALTRQRAQFFTATEQKGKQAWMLPYTAVGAGTALSSAGTEPSRFVL